MRYLLLVSDTSPEADLADVEPKAWVKEMRRRGVRLEGGRLRPRREARTVRVRRGEVVLSDGPYAETKEQQIGGFDLLECKDLDEAIEVAAKHPAAQDGWVEVRPLW